MKGLFSTFLLCLLFFGQVAISQNRFSISDPAQDQVSVPFKLVNNMIVISAKVNGAQLTFLVDTGIKKTLMFNLKFSDTLFLKNVEKLTLRGLGEESTVNAIKSNGNLFNLKNIVNPGLSLYMITDNMFDLSSKLGMDVHGIIGGDLFNDFVVKINYATRKLTFVRPERYQEKNCGKCQTFPLDFYGNKPYIDVLVENELGKVIKVKLLIDSGGGDALWLFPHSHPDISVPEKHFDDFLGRGLGGNIYGKRSRLKQMALGRFQLEDVSVSFPDSTSIVQVHANKERNGTLGAGILKRFHVVMNYPKRTITLKKNNRYFGAPFLYNKSGMEIEYGGEILVKEKRTRVVPVGDGETKSITDIIYSYGLTYKPSFKIATIRKGSPAHLAGLLVGDIVLEINSKASYEMTMEEVYHLLSSKDNRRIKLLVDRNGKHLHYEFYLKDLL